MNEKDNLPKGVFQSPLTASEEYSTPPCCPAGKVHVAFRGISDDRLYIVYGRSWSEVRYFKQHSLRVFCADCRRRLL